MMGKSETMAREIVTGCRESDIKEAMDLCCNYLPGDLMLDILSRLPVKSLMRFKCVSKTWCSLPHSAPFITMHLLNQNNNTSNTVVLLSLPYFVTDLGDTFVFMTQPHVTPCGTQPLERIEDDYGCQRPTKVEVFTLSTNTWREVKAVVPCAISERHSVVTKNRFLHWMATGFGNRISYNYVLTFDLENEVFRQITVPYADTPWLETYRRLVEYKESLAMFVYLESWFPGVTVRCEMWVMNDYGGGGTKEVSWIKELRVEHLSRVGRPLGWLNGDIVFGPWLGYGHNVFLYDPHTKQVKDISTHEGSGYFFPYKESLVLARGGINYRSCPVCCCRSG
ncbi:unnamed protein product [Ilex paraguariensis]|uniref:F-box domain-containing protein n=1 Tax=Ilex paraguariensis TaxID=185542 RepID=A0ABC8RX69_9AQUA